MFRVRFWKLINKVEKSMPRFGVLGVRQPLQDFCTRFSKNLLLFGYFVFAYVSSFKS
jgi:hypothetical protein